MTHGKKNLRIMITGAVVALAVAAPVAQASPSDEVKVCNQATHVSLGGTLLATDGYDGSAARFTDSLRAHRGKGAGLVNAAAHSSALSACIDPEDRPVVGPSEGAES